VIRRPDHAAIIKQLSSYKQAIIKLQSSKTSNNPATSKQQPGIKTGIISEIMQKC